MRAAAPAAARNGRVALAVAGVALAMAGLSFAAVPLYDLFCRVTGYGGTTGRAAAAAAGPALDRTVTVRFNADTAPALDWAFEPLQRTMTLRVGDTGLAWYRATNLGARPSAGTASFNVTPHLAGAYFMKIECFCFTEQVLAPGESAELPVSFYVDPEIAGEEELRRLDEVTLSYTFFPDPDAAPAAVR